LAAAAITVVVVSSSSAEAGAGTTIREVEGARGNGGHGVVAKWLPAVITSMSACGLEDLEVFSTVHPPRLLAQGIKAMTSL
jgi:hypothetical protein